MITLHTYAKVGIWQPDVEGNTSKKIAGPSQVSTLKLSSGGGSAAVAIYDSSTLAGCSATSLKWFLDCSTTDNDVNTFAAPLRFDTGVFCILEQGVGTNPKLCISTVAP